MMLKREIISYPLLKGRRI